jgi:hypothetical protein
LRQERRLRVLDNRVLRKIFVPKGTRQQGSGENYVTRSFMFCSAHTILLGYESKKKETDGAFVMVGGRVTGGSRRQTTGKTEV